MDIAATLFQQSSSPYEAKSFALAGSVDTTFICFDDPNMYLTFFFCEPPVGLRPMWRPFVAFIHERMTAELYCRFFILVFQTIGIPVAMALDMHQGQINGFIQAAEYYGVGAYEAQQKIRFCWFHVKNALASRYFVNGLTVSDQL